MWRRLLYGSVLLVSQVAVAQQFGGTPPSVKWKQINTDTARIIFPSGLDSPANRIASVIHYMTGHAFPQLALGQVNDKINIVLQNQTTIPNAYVGLGPYRSEFFLTPEFNNFEQGSVPWPDQLAVHEYRHVMQFNNFHNGLSKLMKTLFGEEGYALAINASIPDWFYEGDAVFNETFLTNQGRGRLPLFLNAFPALWKSGYHYSWMKLRNGSLKDYVPSHYYLGYLLVNYGRQRYGIDFWSKVTQDASAYKGLLYPFQKAIQRYAGVDYKTFRQQALDFYKKDEVTALGKDSYNPRIRNLTRVNKQYVTSYFFPYTAGRDSLVYLKSSYRHLAAFYVQHGGKEHKIRTRDISLDRQFSYRNGKIVYAAYESDPRWSWRDYSVIRVLDIQSGKQRTLTRKTKYFTPDLSPDGSRVATVRVDEHGKSELHILDAANGAIRNVLRSTEIDLFTDPKFIDDKTLVTAVRLKDGQMALALADVEFNSMVRLTNPSFNVIGYPSVNDGMIYFTASYGGNDDVFAFRISDKKIFRITDGSLGYYYVNAGKDVLTWSAYTADGYQLRQMDKKDIDWKEVESAAVDSVTNKYNSKDLGLKDILLNDVPYRHFPVTDYRKSTRFINFHSWRPYYSDPIFTYSLFGENILNTFQTELYYLYNQNEKTSAAGLNAEYAGWFPHLHVGTEYTFNREDVVNNKTRHWDQLDSRLGFSIPLSLVDGLTIKNFNVGTFYVLRNEFNKGYFKDSIGNSNLSYLQHFISWSQQISQATQHLYPHLGYALSATHRYAITKFDGYQFIGSAALYFPGILGNHNFIVSGYFQQVDTLQQVSFANQFPYSRGYEGRYFSRMWRLSANYHLPLIYPDCGFGNILYLQQVRANGFYDFTRVYSRDKTMFRNQRSVGGEIFVDTKWWNQYPLTFGFRVSRLLDQDQFDGFKGTVFEFILPVSIIPR